MTKENHLTRQNAMLFSSLLARISKLMGRYVYAVAFQGMMQVAIIVIMARFVTGL